MIYQFNDSAKASDLEIEPSSTIYCNSSSLIQAGNSGGGGVGGHAGGSATVDIRKNTNYLSGARSTGSSGEVIGNRGSRMSSVTGNHGNRNCRGRRMYDNSDSSSSKSTASYGSTCTDSSCSGSESSSTSGEPNLPYPGFPEISLKYLRQDTRPRNWCLLLITNPWFERISILVILFNCITLGMYQPCVDDECVTNRCKILQVSVIAYKNIELKKREQFVPICSNCI